MQLGLVSKEFPFLTRLLADVRPIDLPTYSPYILNDPFFERSCHSCHSQQIGTEPHKLCSTGSGPVGSDVQFKMFSLPLSSCQFCIQVLPHSQSSDLKYLNHHSYASTEGLCL